MKGTQSRRDLSLDGFRGVVVFLMVLVNFQGGDTVFPQFRHAKWDGLTLADLVFPWFLLIVGLSVPLALAGQQKAGTWKAILRRTVLLFAIGVVLGWLISPSFDPAQIRWAGVLQRIAIVYLACAILVLVTNTDKQIMVAAVLTASLLLAVHSLLLLHVGPPGGTPSLAAGEGLPAWLDQHFLPGKAHRGNWDPEGILSTLPSIASGLIGVAVSSWMLMRKPGNLMLAAVGVLLLIGGMALTPVLPLNKNLWTASFTLATAGLGLLAWAALRIVWPHVGQTVIGRTAILLGQPALTFYVVHMLLIALLVRKLPDGVTVWEVAYGGIEMLGTSPSIAALLFALIFGTLCLLILQGLKARGWVLKL